MCGPTLAEARLGGNSTLGAAQLGSSEVLAAANFWAQGTEYEFSATTTRYGHTVSSCGSVNTAELVRGLNYTAVASAQAMQPDFPAGSSCTWECQDGLGHKADHCPHKSCGGNADGRPIGGCSCKQVGSCWCGQANEPRAAGTGTAALGCFTCAKGRFIRKRPYTSDPEHDTSFASPELHLVVADICPYGSNAKWCPGTPGDVNVCGEKNHLDFTDVPPGIDNHFFIFSPAECSKEILERFEKLSRCSTVRH